MAEMYCVCGERKLKHTTNIRGEIFDICANCGREIVRLQPGDYVSTKGMTEEQYHAVCKAFMDAGAKKGEYGSTYIIDYVEWDFVGWVKKTDSYISRKGNCLFHFMENDRHSYFKRKRQLTIQQTLDAKGVDSADSAGQEETKMDIREAYKVMQANCGIEVGDTVKVLRKADDYEMGWYAVWDNSRMDYAIGAERKVVKITDTGIILEFSGGCAFPFFVLELMKKAPKLPAPIRISSQYKAAFREDGGIDVGCQSLSFDKIEEIYLAAKGVKDGLDSSSDC